MVCTRQSSSFWINSLRNQDASTIMEVLKSIGVIHIILFIYLFIFEVEVENLD